ncbi:GNAT family N-acetyltransferase [Actinoplanes sp. NPDC026623]|uniref:GNAT family N-acetyltransferase n=1 Tax=Actinoplanes sp. NPDC026623 TaxID=3155610 RepID=UPI0033E30328
MRPAASPGRECRWCSGRGARPAIRRSGRVGVASIYLDIASVRFGRRASIEDLAVRREWRSRGIGASLLTTAKAWTQEHGADYVFLESGANRGAPLLPSPRCDPGGRSVPVDHWTVPLRGLGTRSRYPLLPPTTRAST